MEGPASHPGPPPGAWSSATRLARRALAPVERFLEIEASSGIVLLAAAALALAWANSPWAGLYRDLWHAPIGVRFGPLSFERDLHFFINDGLMTIFFFVVGLEIRREIYRGELSELRRAALPVVAALGGMIAPVVIFLSLTQGRGASAGWGVPMATDIAFAVGVLALLGPRVPPALRILLLALAVIDDVGAILVIAFFYSSGFSVIGFEVLAAGIAGILLLQKFGVRATWAYVLPALVVWEGAYAAGIHPTLAGVAVGLLTPATAWYGPERFLSHADASVLRIREVEPGDHHALLPHLNRLDRARREAVSPLDRHEHALHGWVAFGIMPLFALANAGVSLGSVPLGGDGGLVIVSVITGLVLGKPVGILGLSWLLSRVGVVALPAGVTWGQVAVVGLVAGIGFTMSLFIAELAFQHGALLEAAKVGVLAASGLAAVIGLLVGRVVLRAAPDARAAATAEEAESRTDA